MLVKVTFLSEGLIAFVNCADVWLLSRVSSKMIEEAQPLVEHVLAILIKTANEGSVPFRVEGSLILNHLVGYDFWNRNVLGDNFFGDLIVVN